MRFVCSPVLYFRVLFSCRPNVPLVFFFFRNFVAGLATKCPRRGNFGHEKVGSIGQENDGDAHPYGRLVG